METKSGSFDLRPSPRVSSFLRMLPVSLVAVVALATIAPVATATAAQPGPFKFTNIHIETNASGCDMGIQILFDTDGITELSVEDPNDEVVFSSQTPAGMEDTHDQTEGFQERVEPPITELENALGCEPSLDAISLRIAASLGLASGARRKDLDRAMKGHILARAEYMGTYERR